MLHRIARRISANGFLAGLLVVLLLGAVFPEPGAEGGWLRPGLTTKLAVIVIFFFNGLSLQSETILRGLSNWRLHVFVQGFLFLLTPVVFLLLLWPLRDRIDPRLLAGFYYLAILPSTISTAVVLSELSGGSQVAALFNATLSNVLGVFLVPLATARWILPGGGEVDAGAMLLRTISLILPALIIGQLVRPLVRRRIDPLRPLLGRINSGLILFIVYAGFADSFAKGIWAALGPAQIALTVGLVAILCPACMALSGGLIRLARFQRPEGLSAFFCSTTKTLAAGAPMAGAIFPAAGVSVGPILIPLLCFFAIQLILGGAVADRFRKSA